MIKLRYPKIWNKRHFFSYILWPLSKIYQFLGFIRRIVTRPIKFPAKVLCIGNITAGGAGKTQVVIWIAKILAKRNIKYVIISKGYGSTITKPVLVNHTHKPTEVGDEALMLAEYGPVISAPKIEEALKLISLLKPQVIIIDDGMQNPGFYKDFTILTVDSSRFFGNGFLIPAGPLREYPRNAINKTDCIVIVGDHNTQTQYELSQNLGEKILKLVPVFYAQVIPVNNIDKTKKYIAFCGIGNPERFFSTLEKSRVELVDKLSFPDHYKYLQHDLDYLTARAKTQNAQLITTQKDYIKVGSLLDVECFIVELSIKNSESLIDLIL